MFTRYLSFLFISLITTFSFLPLKGYSESLLDIYSLALENDHQLKADTAAYRAGMENITISRSKLLPNINASANFSNSEYDFIGYQSTVNGSIPGNGETDNESYSLTLTQPIINMPAWFGYQQGKALSEQSKAQFSAAQQALIIRTSETYFNVLRAIDDMETAQAEEKALSHQLEQTNQRFEVGLTAITDVHEAQAAYDSATATTVQALGALGIAFDELEVLTGQAHNSVAPLVESYPIAPPEPSDRHAWVEFSLQNNYQLKVAELASEAARQNSRIKASGHLPTLTASINYVNRDDTNTEIFANGSSTPFPLDSRYDEQSSIALNLNIPIFSGLGVSGERRQAKQQQIQAQEIYNKTQRDIIQQTRSLHLSVVTNVAQNRALKQAITSSQSALEATQAGYDVGTRNLVDVLVAQRNLYQSQRNYDQTRYNYIINMLQLKQVIGNLTPADILQLNRWLDVTKTVLRSHYEK